MEIQKLYRIIVDVQYGDMLDECDKLYDGKGYGTVFTDANGDAVIDYLKQWDSDEWTDDDIRSEEPRWVNNGTDSVHQKDGYTLIYNSTIGGVYMLYREANAAEIEWYNKFNILDKIGCPRDDGHPMYDLGLRGHYLIQYIS